MTKETVDYYVVKGKLESVYVVLITGKQSTVTKRFNNSVEDQLLVDYFENTPVAVQVIFASGIELPIETETNEEEIKKNFDDLFSIVAALPLMGEKSRDPAVQECISIIKRLPKKGIE